MIFIQFGVFRQDEANVQRRELGVAFRDLRVTGFASANDVQPTLGSTFNLLGIPKAIRASRHPVVKDILSGFEGVVRPGEMLCTSSLYFYSDGKLIIICSGTRPSRLGMHITS